MRPLLFSLLCLCLMAGCKSDEIEDPHNPQGCDVKCTPPDMPVAFSEEFSLEEIDTLRFEVFEPGGGFSQLISDTLFTLNDTTPVYYAPYEMELGFTGLKIDTDHDFQLTLLSTGQVIRIWNISAPELTIHTTCKIGHCDVNIKELSLSGSNYSITGTVSEYGSLQLKK